MPKRTRSSSGYSKRRRTSVRSRPRVPRYSVRSRPRTTGTRIQASLGLPQKALVKHKYVEYFAITLPESLAWSYRFSCNSTYDPNYTGTGHQPLYRDEFANLFNQYRVISSKIKWTLSRANFSQSNTNIPLVACLSLDDDATSHLDIRTEQENGRNTKFVGADGGTLVMRQNWSAKRNFPSATADNLAAAAGASPAEQMFFHLMVQATDLASSVPMYMMVEIEYFTQWFEKKTPVAS